MVRNGEFSVRDAKRVLRKYWWIVPLTVVLCGSAGYVATRVLPARYTSETKVLVDEPIVSAEYVKPVVSEDLNLRITSMKAQILSGPRLQPIIEKFNLYPDLRATTQMGDLVDKLKGAVDVDMLQPTPGSWGRAPGFHIKVTYDKPQLAQQICSEILSVFMEQNALRRMEQTQKTHQFMGKEVLEAKANLDKQDAKLAEFKRQFIGSLPDEEQSNLGLLQGLNTQLEATTQSLNRVQQDKAINESLLSQQEASWKSAMTGGMQNPDTMEQQLVVLQDQLSNMLMRYTPDYPDVIKLKSQIEALKSRMAADPGAKPATPSVSTKLREPAQLVQLRTRIQQDELNIVELTKRQNSIQERIRLIEGRVQASPMVEEKYKDLTRDYQTAQQIYNDLLKKQSDSSIATDLESEKASEVFRILDPPNYPLSPSFPKPLVFIGGGFGAGLALAVAILYLLAMLDQAMYSERDVENCLKLPVLVSLPRLSTDTTH